MAGSKVLVVYYSRKGNTRLVAEEIARGFGGCDIDVIRDNVERRGILGYLRSGYQAARGQTTELRAPKYDPSRYDLVIVGTPVWSSSVSTPVRSYLLAHAADCKKVAFFLTHGSSGRARVFRQMTELAGKQPLALLSVRERELAHGPQTARVRDFVEQLESSLPRGQPEVVAHGIGA